MSDFGGDPFGATKTSIFTNMMRNCFGELMKDVKTTAPGYVVSFNPTTQLAQVQIGLKTTLRDNTHVDPSVLIEVPVHFWGGPSGTLEAKIVAGTEGLIHFSQECIDSWVEQGGISIKPEMRRHDQNDAFFIPGVRSKPNAIGGFANDGIRLRNADASSYVWVRDDGSVEINGTMLNVLCPATFSADVDTMAALRNFLVDVGYLHTHTGVQSGNGTSGPVLP